MMISEQPQNSVHQHHVADYFLHAELRGDPDLLYRGRILVVTLCSFVIFVTIAAMILLVLPTPAMTRIVGLALDLTIIVTFVAVLFRLKKSGSYVSSAYFAIAIALTSTTLAVCVSGGMNTSPVATLFVVPPIMAYFFNGVRGGTIITVMGALLIVILMIFDFTDIKLPQIIESDRIAPVQGLAVLLGFSIAAVLSLVYETTSQLLQKDRDAEHQKVIVLAHIDSLTGLANRRIFDKTLLDRIAVCSGTKPIGKLTLCCLDLNGFKTINDRHGHDVGDQILRSVAIRLRSALRGADMLSRQGGDEFMLLLDETGDVNTIRRNAQRLLKIIEAPIETSSGLLAVSGSLGFAIFPADATDIDQLKKCADYAMYDAKRNNQGWSFYSEIVPKENKLNG